MDFKGVTTEENIDSFVSIKDMKISMADELNLLKSGCQAAIIALGRRPEIVDEGDWLHIGIWPLNSQPSLGVSG